MHRMKKITAFFLALVMLAAFMPIGTAAALTVTPMVAAGHWHTVGLVANGTVVAAGSNSSGQCNVSDWSDIVAVTAGAYHTVGLKNDGTVVATGYNYYGQCNVTSWSNIVAIAASGTHTVGLRANGTVVATGNYNSGITAWQSITAIAAGNGFTMGVKSNGTVVTTESTKAYDSWSNIKQLTINGVNVAGLRNNGTAVSTLCSNEVQSWSGIVQIVIGSCYTDRTTAKDHVLALGQNGKVMAAGGNENAQCDVSSWTDITSIAAGDRFSIGLKGDGYLLSTGNNEQSQRSTGDWNLNKTTTVDPPITIFAPQASRSLGTYVDMVKVKLESSTTDATIYYTSDGSTPTTKSTALKNGGTVTIRKTTTLKYIAVSGSDKSSMMSGKYTIQTVRPDSNAAPTNKTVKKNSTITLKTPSGNTIYYTTNGKTPTTSSTKLASGKSKKLTIKETTTVKLIMVKTGCSKSEVLTRKYTVK